MNYRDQKKSFLNAYARYHGLFTPQDLVFNANLQEFANQVGIICALETGGKLSSEEAYKRILSLWEDLRDSKENLMGGKSAN